MKNLAFCKKHNIDNSGNKFGICYQCVKEKESVKVWNGEGLPPVGTVCQWLASGDHDWINVTVLGS